MSIRKNPHSSITLGLVFHYNASIVLKDTKLKNIGYTGKFRQRDRVENILRKLQIVYPFNYSKNDERNLFVLQ